MNDDRIFGGGAVGDAVGRNNNAQNMQFVSNSVNPNVVVGASGAMAGAGANNVAPGASNTAAAVYPDPTTSGQVSPQLNMNAVKNKKSIVNMVIIILLSLISITAIVFAIMFYIGKAEAQKDIDVMLVAREAAARAEQRETDEINFADREKQPNLEFMGPSDYGSLSFMYPKTWSVYVAKDANKGGDFEAYLHPVQVDPVSASTINALRATIYDRPIENVRTSYDSLVKNGKLTMSVFQVGERTGARYDGEFSRDIIGSMVMLKINDKTAVIRTDAEQFRPDFEALIKTLRHN